MNWVGLYTVIRRGVERVFRVSVQTIMTPLISATLFIFVFGSIVGTRIDAIGGFSYILFVFPGILMMNVLSSAFSDSSSTVYFMRFQRSIEEILVAPLSHLEMLIGIVSASVIRALIVGAGVLIIGELFGAVHLHSLPLFAFYTLSISIIFALTGIIVGLWAKGFEQFTLINTFIITPLSFLGGMFYTVDMLPTWAQHLTAFNPLFYTIDGMRYAMLGTSQSSISVGMIVITLSSIALFLLVLRLFSIGWRIRE
jgi:ABC-2 type transport system permease protein